MTPVIGGLGSEGSDFERKRFGGATVHDAGPQKQSFCWAFQYSDAVSGIPAITGAHRLLALAAAISAIVQGFFLGVAPNLLMTNYASNSVTVYMGDAQAVYTAIGDFPVGTGPTPLMMNQAGLLNFITTNSGSNSITRLDYTGNGTFNHSVSFPAGGMPVSIGQGVLTRSGVSSLVVANEADSTLNAYREKSIKPYFAKPVTLPTCSSPKAVLAVPPRSNAIEDLIVVCSEGVGVMLNMEK